MTEAYGFESWWLIPLIMIGLCIWWGRGCRSGWRHRHDAWSEGQHEVTSDSAREILNMRYARGEIDAAEYEEKRKAINPTNKGEAR